MKLNKYIIAFSLFIVGLTGCNTDDLEKDIDALKDKISSIDTQVQALNDNMNVLRVALDGNKTIQKCTDNGDGSYTLLLSDGNTLTLTQGVEGNVFYPQISIDGEGYWVIDGVKQDYKAEAEDGKDGFTPKFRLENEGTKSFWYVSYDGGETYTALLDLNGSKVQANAENSITVSGDDFPISDINAFGDKLTFKVGEQEYSIPIVEDLKCVVTIPDESKEDDYCLVPTKSPLELDIDVTSESDGATTIINASTGWIATIENGKLKITGPKEEDKVGVISIQVNKGVYWAVTKINVKSKYIITSYYQAYLDGYTLNIAGLEINNVKYPNGANLINNSTTSKTISAGGLYFVTSDATNVKCTTSNAVEELVIISDTPNEKTNVTFTTSIKLGSTTLSPKLALYGLNVEFSFTTVNPIVLSNNQAVDLYMDYCGIKLPKRNQLVEISSKTPTPRINKFIMMNSEVHYDVNENWTNMFLIQAANVEATATDSYVINEINFENNLFYNISESNTITGFRILNGQKVKVNNLIFNNNTIINMQSSVSNSVYSYFYCNSIQESVTVRKNILWFDQDKINDNICLVRPSVKPECENSCESNIGYGKDDVNILLFYNKTAPDNAELLERLTDSPLELTNRENGVYTITNDLYKDYGYQRK